MSWSRWVSCLLSAAVVGSGCDSSPRLQVLGESTRLATSKPSPKTSALFDGEQVRLRGARGETLGVNVRLRDAQPTRVSLSLPSEIGAVSGFEVRSLEVKEPSSAMYGKSGGAGAYPDVLVPQSGAVEARGLAYFDVSLAANARPGRYQGTLAIGERNVPVEVVVSSATIDISREPLVWVFYLPREIARVHGLPDDDAPALLEREREYDALFRAHGAYLAADLSPERTRARRGFMKGVQFWPVAVDSSSDANIERDVRAYLEMFADTGVTPFAIPIDEPHTPEARSRARHIAEVMGRAGGGRPRLLRAVTDAWSPFYGDSFDLYFSPVNFPEPARSRRARGERYWTYNGRPPGAGSMILDTDGVALRTWGWIAERYDIELWYAWEGLYFTDRYNRGGPTDVMKDPLTFDERSRGGSDWGNGDGLLVYPGPLPSLRLKSLRRGLQDRLLLRHLSHCGGRSGREQSARIVASVVPRALGEATGERSWSIEESVWESARQRLLDTIEKECHEPAALAH